MADFKADFEPLTYEELEERTEGRAGHERTAENFCTGLKLLKPLMERLDYVFGAEHDIIYVHAGPPTSEEQQIALFLHGFTYDPDVESWSIYV